MAISDNDTKLLWGRAAGICSNPNCREDLTIVLDGNRGFNVGEMAHVIAKKPDGPRGQPEGGPDAYENLLLLCPTCHRTIDKAPAGEYPPALLHRWKSQHESAIRSSGKNQVFESLEALKTHVAKLLAENKALWRNFGPHSPTATADPGSNLHEVWTLRKLDTIVPNNTKIINAIEANANLLSPDQTNAFMDFKLHATAFERHQYRRLDTYPRFPVHFEELLTK